MCAFYLFLPFCLSVFLVPRLSSTMQTNMLNKHLSSLMLGLTAKVFRTYNASITLQQQLRKLSNSGSHRQSHYSHTNTKLCSFPKIHRLHLFHNGCISCWPCLALAFLCHLTFSSSFNAVAFHLSGFYHRPVTWLCHGASR